jgi:uncharacterized protein YidB (DUF937 family)
MTVNPIGSTSSAWGAYGATPPPPPPLTGTAKLLGLSTDDLQTAMQSGTTLDQIAQQKGVSQSDLISSIATDLQANAPSGAPQPSQTQLTSMATDIAAGKRPRHHHHHGGGGDSTDATSSSSSGAAGFESLASALGMQGDDLLSAFESGSSLSDIATQQGTTLQSVLSGLQGTDVSLLDTTA